MTIYSKNIKTKYIIIPLLFIIFWQFTFPQTTLAKEDLEKLNESITVKFSEQWKIDVIEKFNRLPVNDDREVTIFIGLERSDSFL